MKLLSLKLDDTIFSETEEITSELNLPRNRYIIKAIKMYNLFNKRRLLKKQLSKESLALGSESMSILHEFEDLLDEGQFQSINHKRFIRKVSQLNIEQIETLRKNIKIVLDL